MLIESKRIICCLDGTWVNSDKGYNKPTVQQPRATLAIPSNVTRLCRALKKRGWDGESQVMYYHPGIGSTGDISDMIAGGVFGIGVSEVRLRLSVSWIYYVRGEADHGIGCQRGIQLHRNEL